MAKQKEVFFIITYKKGPLSSRKEEQGTLV